MFAQPNAALVVYRRFASLCTVTLVGNFLKIG